MGHFCRICGRERANEGFSGKGHRMHVCKECATLPSAERERALMADELWGLLGQSRISAKNKARLNELVEHADAQVRELAGLLLRVAACAPGRRKRWARIRHADEELYAACEQLGLIDETGDDFLAD